MFKINDKVFSEKQNEEKKKLPLNYKVCFQQWLSGYVHWSKLGQQLFTFIPWTPCISDLTNYGSLKWWLLLNFTTANYGPGFVRDAGLLEALQLARPCYKRFTSLNKRMKMVFKSTTFLYQKCAWLKNTIFI